MKKTSILLTIIIALTLIPLTIANTKITSQSTGQYTHIYDVDNEGTNNITVTYETSIFNGESWFLVPRNFTTYTITIISGEILKSEIKRAYTPTGEEFTFYDNYTFKYNANPTFKLKLNYTMKNGALIVEPNCFFYSPQIYFNPSDKGIVYIYLPENTKVSNDKIQPTPTSITWENGKHKVTIQLQSNSARIAIEYTTTQPAKTYTYIDGIFTVITPERYKEVAENLIKTYNMFYNNLTKIFQKSLTNIRVKFFAPKLSDLGTGGYIPFNGTHLGDIYLNLLYIRTAQGFWEQIALHELIHHFAWITGISPNLLWLHEGLAEYLSIKLIMDIGWEGASSRKQTLETIAKTLNDNYGFIQWWNPLQTPPNILNYYSASYMVIKGLVEDNGGITFLQKLFKELSGKPVSDTDTILQYMNKASGRDLTIKFIEWGFKISGESKIYNDIVEAKYLLSRKRFAQPFTWIANILLDSAINLINSGNMEIASIIVKIGIFIAMFSITLTVLLWCGIITIILWRTKYE